MVGPEVLVILDGASEPLRGDGATSLERARTPRLDGLARTGSLSRVRTVPAGVPAGSEVAIPVLLGWTPPGPVDRGAVEAAARGIGVPPGARAWRVDVVDGDGDGDRAPAAVAGRAARALRAAVPDHDVHRLAGHRLLLVGPPPLPDAVRGAGLRVWPDGVTEVPRVLDATTVVVAARGAGAGVAALLGARVVVPAGATGDPGTDLAAKAASAVAAMGDAGRVVVHVGGADEAAHARDPAGKAAFLTRADRELIGPMARAVGRAGGTLRVCADHGCDPATGAHDAAPVPHLRWSAGGAPGPARRFSERAVADLAVTDLTTGAPAVA